MLIIQQLLLISSLWHIQSLFVLGFDYQIPQVTSVPEQIPATTTTNIAKTTVTATNEHVKRIDLTYGGFTDGNSNSGASSSSITSFTSTDTIALHWASLAALDNNLAYVLAAVSVNSTLQALFSSIPNENNPTAKGGMSFLNSTYSSSVSTLYMSIYDQLDTDAQSQLKSLQDQYYTSFALTGYNDQRFYNNFSTATTTTSVSIRSEMMDFLRCREISSDMELLPYNYILMFASKTSETRWLTNVISGFSQLGKTEFNQASACANLNSITSAMPWGSFYDYFATSSYNQQPLNLGNATTILPYDTFWVTITDTASPSTINNYYPFQMSYSTPTYLAAIAGLNRIQFTSSVTVVKPITATIPATVSTTGTTRNSLHDVVTISPNLTRLVNCGVRALVYDYYQNSSEFDQYVMTNLNDSYIRRYTEILNSFTTKNINTDAAAFQMVNAGYYNFIFQNPPERMKKLIDMLGYCYMEIETNNDAFAMTKYTSGGGDAFNQIFAFGGNNQYITYVTTTFNGTVSSGYTSEAVDFGGSTYVFPLSIEDGLSSLSITGAYFAATNYSIANIIQSTFTGGIGNLFADGGGVTYASN
ncbi:unnamed protein product [Ambrosiozyma monospora]|uniref:Unnamed protein product n=1 Tax=Ambrosiozyma monospora TaxID=43982 RepID=A0ACB5SY53_AMBMO|nr:unnamed protein product [Ambrosiozyma monospora]